MARPDATSTMRFMRDARSGRVLGWAVGAWVWVVASLGGHLEAAASTNSATLFGLTNLWTIHLTIPFSDWQKMSVNAGPRERSGGGGGGGNGLFDGIFRGAFGGDENNARPNPRGTPRGGGEERSRYPWAACSMECGGQVLTNVGIRFKGVSSFVRAPNGLKRPFKLDFDRGVKGRRFQGVEEFYLNNNVNDATQMREALAYELFRRAGLPAPRTAFARLYLTIPGRVERQHLGLYTLVESVEADFLKLHFGTKKGLLLKPEMMNGLEYLGDDWRAYAGRYDPKTDVDPKDADRFMEFVRFIHTAQGDEFSTGIRDYLEPEPFLKFVALNAILANVDSFLGNGHNYFLYESPATRRATFIPWDVNEAFGMHPVSGPSRTQMQFSILRPNGDPNLLIERFINDRNLARAYRTQCAWMLTNVFVVSRLTADIDRIAAVTKPVVMAESRRARADFERTVLGTMRPDEGDTSQPRHDREIGRDGYRPWGFPDAVEIDNLPLKDWVAGRHAHCLGQLEGRTRAQRMRPRLF